MSGLWRITARVMAAKDGALEETAGFGQAVTAVASVVMSVRESFCLCSVSLPERIFDARPVIRAARDFACKNPRTMARLLVIEPRRVTSRLHPFIEMCQLFPDSFSVRTLAERVQVPAEDFLLNDQGQGICFPLPGRSRFFLPDGHIRSRLETVFGELWHHAVPAVELRRLLL